VQARAANIAGGVWSAIQTLSDAGRAAFGPQVAVDSGGNAVVTWYRFDNANTRVQARRRTAGGALSSVQTLSDAGQNAFNPDLGVDSAGNAVVTWYRFDGANFRVQVRARSSGGTVSAVQTLSAAGQDATNPQVGVDLAGEGLVVWPRSDGSFQRIQARARTAGGTVSATQTLSDAGGNAHNAQVGVDSAGNAVVVWQRFDGANTRVQARTRTVGGALGTVQNLSLAGQNANIPQVGVDSGGEAVATWAHADAPITRIQAAAGP
jgi:hypothetical protein